MCRCCFYRHPRVLNLSFSLLCVAERGGGGLIKAVTMFYFFICTNFIVNNNKFERTSSPQKKNGMEILISLARHQGSWNLDEKQGRSRPAGKGGRGGVQGSSGVL